MTVVDFSKFVLVLVLFVLVSLTIVPIDASPACAEIPRLENGRCSGPSVSNALSLERFVYQCASCVCDPEYHLEGRPKIFCMSNNKWTAMPKCIPIDLCTSLPGINDGYCVRTLERVNVTFLINGDTANCKCNDGFSLASPDRSVVQQEITTTCRGRNSFNLYGRDVSDARLTCFKQCPAIPSYFMRQCQNCANPTETEVRNNVFIVSDQVAVWCQNNPATRRTLNCRADGQWDSPFPTCS